jgi:ATP-dependent exoDNAse (exonuclease V) beta subunit
VNAERVDDAAVRERAIRTDLSVLLSAPAGSGKTSVLTHRLLALLGVVDSPDEILAVTFTRKAAAEMRARVLGALAGRIDDSHPEAALTHRLAGQARARAEERGWHLASHPAQLRILTLDAFNFSLAAQLPLAAGGRTAIAVADRPGELYERAARRTLEEGEFDPRLAPDIQLLFERLDNRWATAERLLAEMLERRAHWLPHLLDHEAGDLRTRVDASLRRVVSAEMADLFAALGEGACRAAATLPGVGPLGPTADTLGAWLALAKALLTDKGAVRRSIDRYSGPIFRDAAASATATTLLQAVTADPDLARRLHNTRSVADPALGVEDAAALAALGRVLTYAAQHLQVEMLAAGRVDHTFIAGAARAALTAGGAPTDLALRIGLNLRHILVDEFQDTSFPQFDLLETLVADWSPGDGRTFFAVGDPMQSIYQFRDAEVGLFLRAQASGIGALRLESLALSRNFRSRPQLVEWVNRRFQPVFATRGDVRSSAVPYLASSAARAPSDAACAEALAIRDGGEEDEAALVAATVSRIRATDPLGTIGVLVHARTRAGSLVDAVHAAGFAVHGVKLGPLRDEPVVRDLTALLAACTHPGDRIAWLTVLRAPWIGLRLATLDMLSPYGDTLPIPQALEDTERLARCEPDERARVQRALPALDGALARCRRLPVAVWLERAWLALGGADAYPIGQLESARALLRALGDASPDGAWPSRTEVDRALDSLFADGAGAAPGGVELMTLHAAKGLEFDHVILPGYAQPGKPDQEPLLRWIDLPGETERDLLMAPFVASEDRAEHGLRRFIRRLARDRKWNETVREMYVAATRARESLHVIVALPMNSKGPGAPARNTPLAPLWPQIENECAWCGPLVSAPLRNVGAVGASTLERLPARWMPASIDEPHIAQRRGVGDQALPVPEFSWVGETTRHVGTVVHGVLDEWGRAGELPAVAELGAQRQVLQAQLARLGVAKPDLGAATDRTVAALRGTLEDSRGRWLFDPTHRAVASELALSGFIDGRLVSAVIDRTFVDREGVRWIVDFKAGGHEGGDTERFLREELKRYAAQLRRYARLAAGLGPEPVRAALYFPLLREFREAPGSAQ